MTFLKEKWHLLVILMLVSSAVALRSTIYGDPRLSVAFNDTYQYISSSEVSLTSWEAWTSRRLFTTNVLYKLFRPEGGYEVLVNGSIATVDREIQPSFTGIALLQFFLSVLGWCLLACVIASKLKNKGMKILAVLVILLFAFTPQMTDWDSVLGSESLTYSLFAIQFSLLILMVFKIHENAASNIVLLLLAWFVVFFFWVFLRDTNVYATALLSILLFAHYLWKPFRSSKMLLAVPFLLLGVFLLGWISSNNSSRAMIAMSEVYGIDILNHPARVEFMLEKGMPPPGTPEYNTWFQDNAVRSFFKFMFYHPGYVRNKFIKDLFFAFTSNLQPYFRTPEAPLRLALIPLGDAMHPESATPFFINLILLFGLVSIAIKTPSQNSRPWAWLGVYLCCMAGITLLASIYADTFGLQRHALFSTMTFRLIMWLFPIVILDRAIARESA